MYEIAIRWSRRARLDVASIHAYIADCNPVAADALRDRVYAMVAALPANPLAHRAGRMDGTREMVVHPNYILIYALDGPTVTILRLLHSARDWP